MERARLAANPRSVTLSWASRTLNLTQEGSGKSWATIESLAAVALKAPFAAGYRITKTIKPIDPAAVKGMLSRGDIMRVPSRRHRRPKRYDLGGHQRSQYRPVQRSSARASAAIRKWRPR